jgi:N-acyl-D-aspartate/D-glutamate deacylase
LVVAPGFIDLHSHGQTPRNYTFKAMDGVTTALELEVGVSPVRRWYEDRKGKALINFGASVGHMPARMLVMKDSGDFLPRDTAMNRQSTPEEQRAVIAELEKGLGDGALGLGMGLAYTPTVTAEEALDLFYVMAKWNRPVFVHVRHAGGATPGIFESLQEIITDAAAAGVPLHIMHINSQALKKTPEALRMIDGARARGLDVTTEAYPYTASASRLESGLFEPGWQEKQGVSYADLQWVATGERLNQESFGCYRKQGGWVVIFKNTEDMLRRAITHPSVIIASDGRVENHPRGAGTYARLLGKYVREEKVLSLMEAIRKCSLMPAQRLESMCPQMRQKGRLKVGADADIVVFAPDQVIDRATFENPAQYSAGFHYVLVEGTFVVRNEKVVDGVTPGQPIIAVR